MQNSQEYLKKEIHNTSMIMKAMGEFEGLASENAKKWIKTADTLRIMFKIEEEVMVRSAITCLKGAALKWAIDRVKKHPKMGWESFKEGLMFRFSNYDYHCDMLLSGFLQKGEVASFNDLLEMINVVKNSSDVYKNTE